MIKNVRVHQLNVRKDHRGWLVEVLRTEQMESKAFGQIHVSTTNLGITRGNHYHTYKKEWFCVIKGNGRLELKDVNTKEELDLIIGESNMVTVYIPPFVAHRITNIGKEMMYLLIYIDHPYDPQRADTIIFEDFS